MKGKLAGITRNLDGSWNLTVTVCGDLRAMWNKFKDKDVDVGIKQWREKRSLDANAYMWVLIDKIAEAMHLDKAEVYRNSIRGIGGVSQVVCAQDFTVDALRQGWEMKGMGWQTDTMPSKVPGCTNVVLYYGSSMFDTHQFSLLLDHVVQDCKALGIETMTPREIENLIRKE